MMMVNGDEQDYEILICYFCEFSWNKVFVLKNYHMTTLQNGKQCIKLRPKPVKYFLKNQN